MEKKREKNMKEDKEGHASNEDDEWPAQRECNYR